MHDPDDTIAAVASAAGGAARGIVRLSGPQIVPILETCFRPREGVDLAATQTPRVASGVFVCASEKSPLEVDADLYLWPGHRSYTRQPLAELHTLGSSPLVARVLRSLCAAGARLAEPGEFTLRAFLAGRIDLTQAEAVLGVVDAQGDGDLRAALSQLAGGLARQLSGVRDRLLDLLAELEAGLDFVEEDIQFVTRAEIEKALVDAQSMVARLEAQMSQRARHDRPPRAVLIGSSNVGKSSLFNALVKGATALVADQPNTTRDYLVATLDLGGMRCQLVDTAGTRLGGRNDPIDELARQATSAAADHGDILLLCIDASRPLNCWEQQAVNARRAAQLVVMTKCDQPRRADVPCPSLDTSALKGLGLEELRRVIAGCVGKLDRPGGAVAATAERSAESVRGAADALDRALALIRSGAGEELVAGEVRLALAELGRVAGAVYSDDVLERIFSRFCIGK